MGKFCLIMSVSATIFLLIVTGVLYQLGVLGHYGQLVDIITGGIVGLIGVAFGGMIAIRNT